MHRLPFHFLPLIVVAVVVFGRGLADDIFAAERYHPRATPFNPDEENSWAFPAECPDPAAESPVDLRDLNEEFAGAHGFIRLSEDGNSFVRGDGEPIRFWGAHMANGYEESKEEDAWDLKDYRTHARWQARLGSNLVRTGIVRPYSKNPDEPLDQWAPALLDSVFKRIAAARENGIYVLLSPVWFHGLRDLGERLGIDPGEQEDAQMWLFIHPEVQKLYKSWLRELLTTKNPYTDLAIKDDPAVAILEFQNEDSLLFYTLSNLDGDLRRILEQDFAAWARAKHGSLESTLETWKIEDAETKDAVAQGRLPIPNIWFMTGEGADQDHPAQSRDVLEFLVDYQKTFYARMKRFVREDLECPQLLAGSNFRSADLTLLDDALRYTWDDLDVIHNNSYFSSGGQSRLAGWRADAGDILGLRSAVTHPRQLPVNKRQVAGKPFIVTETLWNFPHPFEAEGPLAPAVYQSLTGVDAALFAGPREKTWENDPYMPWWEQPGTHPMRVFSAGRAPTMGQFPAAALIYRKGYLQPGLTVVAEKRSREAILNREPPLITEGFAFDFVHFDEDHQETQATTHVPRDAFLVGRVAVDYDADPAKTELANLEPYLPGDGRILSSTGQIVMDRVEGLLTFSAPKAQGAVGFLRDQGEIELEDVTIESANPHAAVTVVSLDDRPLTESRQVLVQFGSRSLPTNWQEEPVQYRETGGDAETAGNRRPGLKVISTGEMPWRVQSAVETTIFIANPDLKAATILDGNGLPQANFLPQRQTDAGISFDFPHDAMYVVLRAE